jgi:hypothetical protein
VTFGAYAALGEAIDHAIEGEKAVEVFTGDERGPWLEFGTSKMAPRPHARPAMREAESKIADIVGKHILESEGAVTRLPSIVQTLVVRA